MTVLEGSGLTYTEVEHVYNVPGIYNIILTVRDDALGISDVTSKQINVGGLLTADAGGPYFGVPDEPVQFDASATAGAPLDQILFVWDFGDDDEPDPAQCNVTRQPSGDPIPNNVLDFGQVVLGSSKDITIRVSNPGDSILVLAVGLPPHEEGVQPPDAGAINPEDYTFPLDII